VRRAVERWYDERVTGSADQTSGDHKALPIRYFDLKK
jgi:hypothetical protein